MTDISQTMAKHTVSIKHDTGNGSGVLIQGMNENYSYVLTAKHVIQIDKNNIRKGVRTESELWIEDFHRKRIDVLNIYSDEKLDITILKISFYPNLQVTAFPELLPRQSEVFLYGCPKGQPSQTYTIKYLTPVDNERIEFSIDENAQVSEMEGFSGGGVFYEKDSQIYIYAVDNSAFKQGDFVNRPRGFHISKFKKLIDECELAELKPLLLTCFNYVKPSLFSDVCTEEDDSLNAVLDILKVKIDSKIINSELTPIEIMTRFEKQLLTYRQQKIELQEEKLWQFFLEFISIQIILSPPQNFNGGWEENFLKNIFKSYRFMYTNKSESYKKLYKQLVAPSDTSMLKDKGKVIIFANGHMPPKPDYLNKMRGIPMHIDVACENGIANVRANFKSTNDIIHWPKLNDECLADKEYEFRALNRIMQEDEILQLIKDGYDEYLKALED
jgi:hypothetical protein